MPEDVCEAIEKILKEKGYKEVESNCGTVWYSDGENTYSISQILCE